MCTVGYSNRLKLLFKNRDKTSATGEVVVFKPGYIAVKTEGADYFSLGTNDHGCGFVSTAVNSPEWTRLADQGRMKEAAFLFASETTGLVNPMGIVSAKLPDVRNVDEWLDVLLTSGKRFLGYNILLVDNDGAAHVEVINDQHHVTRIKEQTVVANHFKYLKHGPAKLEDYPGSFQRQAAAESLMARITGLEDLFSHLIPCNGQASPFWRTGSFATVSSSILDLDSTTLYYCTDPAAGYGRLTRCIPPKGAERMAQEMSRYIDLPTYHKIEREHPFYEEMLQEIVKQIGKFHALNGQSTIKTLELGAGTGLCSLELVKQSCLDLNCLELDSECCAILERHPEAGRYKVIQGDAVTYNRDGCFDLLVSTFAHDHVHYNRRFAFAANIRKNLRPGGRYIMGGEILPYFSTDVERKRSLFRYHNNIIELAIQSDHVQLCELENNALKSGLDQVGDFKRHEQMFEHEMQSAGMKLVEKIKLGPLDREDLGGVYVYVYEA